MKQFQRLLCLAAALLLCALLPLAAAAADGDAAAPPADPAAPTADPAEPTPTAADPGRVEAHDKYISGLSTGLFGPNNPLTRAQLAQILYNLAPAEAEDSAFPDVRPGAWYAKAVNALAARGILQGYPDGSFKPGKALSRAELAVILYRLAGLDTGAEDSFPDVAPTHWAGPAVTAARDRGWVQGYPDGSFGPNKSVTRAQAVTMINRFLGRSPDAAALEEAPSLCFFPDVLPGAWYYGQVMEAAVPHSARYESAGAAECWQEPQAVPALLEDGLHCMNGSFYVTRDGSYVRSAGTGAVKGIAYRCEGETGVCVLNADVVTTAEGDLVLVSEGRPLYSPGAYPTGVCLFGGGCYVAVGGKLVNTAKTGVLEEMTYRCAGASGLCELDGPAAPLADGNLVLLSGGKPLGLPGSYQNGIYLHQGRFYAAVDGRIVNRPASGAAGGVSWTCTGSSGQCRLSGVILTTVDGARYHLVDGWLDEQGGPFEYDGALYCAKPYGALLQGGTWNTLYFGDDGRYTSGNRTIDAYVDGILSQVVRPGMTDREKLRAAYDYIYYHMYYRSNNNHVPRGQDCTLWVEANMLRLIEQGKGNCYCFASEMYYLGRRLGWWQIRALSGGVQSENYDHGWCEIELDGVRYLLDPELNAKSASSGPGRLFLIPYSQAPWVYWRP